MLDQMLSNLDIADPDGDSRRAEQTTEERPQRGIRGWLTRILDALGGGVESGDQGDPRNDDRSGRGRQQRYYQNDPDFF